MGGEQGGREEMNPRSPLTSILISETRFRDVNPQEQCLAAKLSTETLMFTFRQCCAGRGSPSWCVRGGLRALANVPAMVNFKLLVIDNRLAKFLNV